MVHDSIRICEEELFRQWRAKRPAFVADGVVDESEYQKAPVKLVYILKEVNDPGGGNWDLREFLHGGGQSRTWDAIARWTKGIYALPRQQNWRHIEVVEKATREMALKTIVAVNIRKEPGGQEADDTTLEKAANDDQEFLAGQLALYTPSLFVCCGTGWLVSGLLDLPQVDRWQKTARGVPYAWTDDETPVIDFVHPEARISKPLVHYALLDAVQEILRRAPKDSRFGA